ncbi:substrate-binding periplasmic protein [Agarivorans sp. QJM3NY_29]|uniref:substrate-binding periplasmic protein n=1 Tax=unclassified Agarivorans TaxID=2636026 RepID=UPI003D7DCE90
MKYHLLVIAVVSVLLTSAGVAHAQQVVISTFLGENATKIVAEKVMMEAYRRIGITMVLRPLPGDRALRSANDGNVDGELFRKAGIEHLYPNLLRLPVPISVTDFVAITKDKRFLVDGWKSLLPYRVGYLRGIKLIEVNLVEGTISEAVKTYRQAFGKLESGRSDVVVTSRATGLMTLKELGLTGLVILEPTLVSIQSFHYLHVKNKHLVAPLTAALQQMEKEGIIRNIQEQAQAFQH